MSNSLVYGRRINHYPTRDQMQVAYLSNRYPAVSTTFIRRELLEVEKLMGSVERFSIRSSDLPLVDGGDESERSRTFEVLAQGPTAWARALRRLERPRSVVASFQKAIELGFRSERGMPYHLAYWAEAMVLVEELAARNVDHVHVHFGTNPTAVAQIVRALGGPSYSFTVHGPDEFDAPRGYGLGPKIRDSAFVVAISDYCAAQLRRWIPASEWNKIEVVHCGVDDDFFVEATPIEETNRNLVCVGRLCPQKGQQLLVEGFAEAIDRGVDATLTLVGDGDSREEIEAYAQRRGIADRLTITGWTDEAGVRKNLTQSRAFVLPSFAEGLPMVIMEAFSLHRPVLSTYVAAIPELVIDGENGWLIPAGSSSHIADGIQRIMDTPVAELRTMGERGCDRVRERHYQPTEAKKLVSKFRERGGAACSR